MQRCTVLIKMVGSKVWICSWMMSVCTAASLKALQNQSTHNSHACSTASSVPGYPMRAACPGARQRTCRGKCPLPCLAALSGAGTGSHTQHRWNWHSPVPTPLPAVLAPGGTEGEPSLQLQQVKDSSGLSAPRKACPARGGGRPGHNQGTLSRCQNIQGCQRSPPVGDRRDHSSVGRGGAVQGGQRP